MKDRVAAKPNRYAVYDDAHNFLRYEYHERADEPTQVGDALNKANLLSDTTAAKYFASVTGVETVNQVLSKLAAAALKDGTAIKDALGNLITLPSVQLDSRVQIATGSYTGTGTYGSTNKTTFVFPFAPKLMIIMTSNGEGMILIPGSTQSGAYWSSGYINGLSNGGTCATLSTTTTIYSFKEPYYQMNRSNTSYYYLAIG